MPGPRHSGSDWAGISAPIRWARLSPPALGRAATHERGWGGLSRRSISERDAAEAADLHGLHGHALRHSAASLSLRGGYPVAAIQVVLGRSSVQTATQYHRITRQTGRPLRSEPTYCNSQCRGRRAGNKFLHLLMVPGAV
ncbi:MAG: tyrosine-type recombinase/integrase [Krumholzibacteria bacterium]|nr:tyrosine-type recombinase/integrase [Candidatus Krumholzibacteria bacterium]